MNIRKLQACLLAVIVVIAASLTSVTPTAAATNDYQFTPNSVLEASRLAHQYWLAEGRESIDTNWYYATFHVGEFAYFNAIGDQSAWDSTVAYAKKFKYRPYDRNGANPCIDTHADHQAAGATFFELATMTRPAAGTLDCFKGAVLTTVNSSKKYHWNWSDALYMAPATWASMAQNAATPEERDAIYEALYQEFTNTKNNLFNTEYGLWARDSRYVYPRNPSPDGSPRFWSRGNGWAFAGLARLLERLPADAPHYDEYRDTFVQMAQRLRRQQQADGFWGSDLLEPYHINQPETSGTAFFTYGMALGVRLNILDSRTYLRTIKQGWLALANTALQDSGRLGWTQGVAHEPYMSNANANSTQPYAVGAFLAASGEIYRLIGDPVVSTGKRVTCSAEPQPDTAPCRQVVDGDVNKRWSNNRFPSEVEIDLGKIVDLSAFRASFYYHRDYQYVVEVKRTARSRWRTVLDQSGNTEGRPEILGLPDGTNVQFVRIRVTGAKSYRGSWASIGELELFGKP